MAYDEGKTTVVDDCDGHTVKQELSLDDEHITQELKLNKAPSCWGQ